MHAIAEPCPSCGSFTMKPSRWRLEDFTFLLRLFRPLRCRSCGDRFYTRIFGRDMADTGETEREFVIRFRIKNPSRPLRALLSLVAEPAPKTRIE